MKPMSSSRSSLNIAVVGSGVSGLAAAWLLSANHRVTLFEADQRIGGHCHTVEFENVPVDTGFIVYNERTYPNLTALFSHLGVETRPTEMSFAVSLRGGRVEYSGSGLTGLLAQPSNALSPRFWSMLSDLRRFYKTAPRDVPGLGGISLAAYLDAKAYGAAFREDHLYPIAAAIWSTPSMQIGEYPAAAFIRFFENHGLLTFFDSERPIWRTVVGGSRAYVNRLIAPFLEGIVRGRPILAVRRDKDGVDLVDKSGHAMRFDHVVLANHADDALAILSDPGAEERDILGAFRYTANEAVLHQDPASMPRRTGAWSSWNYLADPGETSKVSVTYWMNRLQGLPQNVPLFVTLNPFREIRRESVIRSDAYRHPTFDLRAMAAQERLWSLQGVRRTWFCGAYFGAGFHEDGLQAGLAVAEALGGASRPWTVPNPSGRITVTELPPAARAKVAAP